MCAGVGISIALLPSGFGIDDAIQFPGKRKLQGISYEGWVFLFYLARCTYVSYLCGLEGELYAGNTQTLLQQMA